MSERDRPDAGPGPGAEPPPAAAAPDPPSPAAVAPPGAGTLYEPLPAQRPGGLNLIGRTFETVFRELGPTLGITTLVHLPLFLLLGTVVALYAAGQLAEEAVLLGGALVLIGSLFLGPLSAAAVIQGVFEHLRGEPIEIQASMRVAFRRLAPVLGLAILSGLAVGAGTLLCIIPGVVVACGLFIATPALLVERLGVTDAFQRSWRLTDGYKLTIFGLLFVLGLIERAVSTALELSLTIDETASGGRIILYFSLTLGLAVMMTTLKAVGAVVAYFEIRRFREGLDEDDLAEIFA